MPITLGDSFGGATGGRNDYILVMFWVVQTIFAGLFVVSAPMMVLAALFSRSNSSFFMAIGAFIAGIAMLGAIIQEIRLFRSDGLTTTVYHEFQKWKALGAFGIFSIMITGIGQLDQKFQYILSLLAFSAPFWGAFAYSVKIRREESGGLDGNGGIISSLW